MRWEILPLVVLSCTVIIFAKFQTEILNLIVPSKYLKMQAFSEKEDRFIARKLSGLISQSSSLGKITLREDLIEY